MSKAVFLLIETNILNPLGYSILMFFRNTHFVNLFKLIKISHLYDLKSKVMIFCFLVIKAVKVKPDS